jgi:pyoverdine/dityrosine biosynthesis protein Dit1
MEKEHWKTPMFFTLKTHMCYVVMKRNSKVLFLKKTMDVATSYTDRYPSLRHDKQGEKDYDKHRIPGT